MSTLVNRIFRQGGQSERVTEMAGKDYGTVKEIPLNRVIIHNNGFAYDEPLVTADGAPNNATGPGQWGQLYAAGKY